MRNYIALLFLVSHLVFAQDLEYINVDVALRNPNLITQVNESVRQALYYEDEGVERRIKTIYQHPRIYLIAKDQRVAKELYISSSYETAMYYSGTNRRAPPYTTLQFDCSTLLIKDTNQVWRDYDTDCDPLISWD